MSERHSVGDYNLEISGRELVVRDHRGDVVETIDLANIGGAFSLPDGQTVDVASLILSEEPDIADFETAAGPANENDPNAATHAPASFRAFVGDDGDFASRGAAGALDNTTLAYGRVDDESAPDDQRLFGEDAPTIPVNWSHHDEWRIPENQAGGEFGPLVEGDPRDFTFDVSDTRFEVADGILQLKDGISFDFESESFIDLDITATSKTGETKTKSVRIDVIDENEGQTGIDLDNATVVENAAGAVIGNLTIHDPDSGDSQSLALSDDRFEVVDGQLKLKHGISLDFETEPSVDVTVTATDKGGNSISQQFTLVVGDTNEAQSALWLDGAYVAENAAGAVIGNLTVNDPDAGDNQAFMVSDSRFEVVNGQLKLRDGVSLDFEAEPTVNVTVTATDKGGHSIAEQFTLGVTDVNEAQSAMSIDNHQIVENAAGAVVGALTVVDPDAGDSQSFQVSDARFEVVNGVLKLKDGISFNYEAEKSVDVTVTATDTGGNSIQQTFTINIVDANEAPVVTIKDGAVESHFVDVTTSYQPTGSAAIGDFLLNGSNGTSAVTKFGSSQISGVDAENLTLAVPTEVSVTFQREGAGYHNMVGVYQFDDAGKIVAGSVKFVWLDATAKQQSQLGSQLVKDFLGFDQASTVSLGTMPEGTHLGFFTIADGAGNASNQSALKGLIGNGLSQSDAMAAINSQLSIVIDANGNGHVHAGDKQLTGHTYFTHDKALNTDFNAGKDIEHALSGVSGTKNGPLVIGFEDLSGGGDRDYEDVVFSVSMATHNVNTLTQNIVQPSVDFSDIDSNSLSQAVIHTTGFQAGDSLTIPPSALFNVTLNHAGNDYTITIVGKTGGESVDQYETFVNSIQFATSSKVEGDRQISYNIVDEGGLTSNVASAKVGVATSYEISSSEMHPSQHELGSGNDHFHLNGSLKGNVDFGDGYDTLHLARVNEGLSTSEKNRLDSVEAIDSTGYGINNVALSITDVLDLTDSNLHLTVVGDRGDVVTLSGDNSGHHWSVAETSADFTTYVWSDPVHQAVVEISNQLTATLSS